MSIPAFFLNQNVATARNLTVKFSHLEVRWVYIVGEFFHAFVWCVLPFQLSMSNQQLCYGIRKQKLVILTSCLSVPIVLVAAYLLIFGKFGLPKLGVAGLGYAMAIQAWFSCIFMLLTFYFKADFKQFDLFNFRVHHNWGYVKRMLQIGLPITIQFGGEMLSFVVTVTLIGWIGADALAANQVVGQYMFLSIIPIFSIAQASGILIGHACGAKEFQEVKRLGHVSLYLVLFLTTMIALIFILFPERLAALYFDVHNPANAQTLHLTTLLFTIVAASQMFDGLRNVLTGALRGLFDSKTPMIVGLAVIWLIGLPLGYFLAFHLHMGVIGMALGSATGMFVGCLAVWYRWHKRIGVKLIGWGNMG